jgi:hypothetical protein
VILLVAAAAAVVAVFAVHRIEERGGPLSEPYATQFFSPGSGGEKGTATVRFTSREPQRATIDVRRCDSTGVVRHLVRNRRVDGPERFAWDGRDDAGKSLADGCYEVGIRLAGDPREYQPAKPTWIDTTAPVAAVDRSAIKDGVWNGLVFTEPGVHLEYVLGTDERLDLGMPRHGSSAASRTTRARRRRSSPRRRTPNPSASPCAWTTTRTWRSSPWTTPATSLRCRRTCSTWRR